MNEVGLGSAQPRTGRGAVWRWQDELPEATITLLIEYNDAIVRARQNTVDSAKDYRGYVAQALVLLRAGTRWVDLDTNVKSGCRSFLRWASTAHPQRPALQAALNDALGTLKDAGAR